MIWILIIIFIIIFYIMSYKTPKVNTKNQEKEKLKPNQSIDKNAIQPLAQKKLSIQEKIKAEDKEFVDKIIKEAIQKNFPPNLQNTKNFNFSSKSNQETINKNAPNKFLENKISENIQAPVILNEIPKSPTKNNLEKASGHNLNSINSFYIKNKINQAEILFGKNNVSSLWHMTHKDNIESIISNGILSNRLAYEIFNPKDISDQEVQRWRDRIDPFLQKPIHDYVPLYINIKNPMLFKRKSIQDEICLIEVSLSVLMEHEFIYTDGNAAARDTLFYENIEFLDNLPWDVLSAKYWNDFPDGKRKRCSEVLIYPKVEPKFFKKIYCKSIHTLQELESKNISASLNQKLFF